MAAAGLSLNDIGPPAFCPITILLLQQIPNRGVSASLLPSRFHWRKPFRSNCGCLERRFIKGTGFHPLRQVAVYRVPRNLV